MDVLRSCGQSISAAIRQTRPGLGGTSHSKLDSSERQIPKKRNNDYVYKTIYSKYLVSCQDVVPRGSSTRFSLVGLTKVKARKSILFIESSLVVSK